MYIVDTAFQNRVFLLSVGFGTLLGVVYDIFRFVRLLSAEKKRAVFVQDFLFLALATALSFIFLLVVNNGSFRFYIFAAMLIGFFAYYFTFGAIFIRMSDLIVRAVKGFFVVAAAVITAPFKLIFKFFSTISKKIWKKSTPLRKKIKNNCKTHLKKI